MTTTTRTHDHEALTAASDAFRDIAAAVEVDEGTLDPGTLRWAAERLEGWATELNPARTIARLSADSGAFLVGGLSYGGTLMALRLAQGKPSGAEEYLFDMMTRMAGHRRLAFIKQRIWSPGSRRS